LGTDRGEPGHGGCALVADHLAEHFSLAAGRAKAQIAEPPRIPRN
jgi:hypothetical protein